jgi:hypothetical protein
VDNDGYEITELSAGNLATQRYVETGISTAVPKWKQVEKITLTEDTSIINIPENKIRNCRELRIEAELVFADNTKSNQEFVCGKSDDTFWQSHIDTTATGKGYFLLNISIGVDKEKIYWDGTLSAYENSLSGESFVSTGKNNSQGPYVIVSSENELWLRTTEDNPMTAGTVIKVWGR